MALVLPGRCHAAGCVVRGAGARAATAGAASCFHVQARDRYGNPIRHGGADLRAQIHMAAETQARPRGAPAWALARGHRRRRPWLEAVTGK